VIKFNFDTSSLHRDPCPSAATTFFAKRLPKFPRRYACSIGAVGDANMDDEPTHLSPDEVRRALDRLRPPDIVRLSLLAHHWARGLGRHDADDLLNEAFDRVLSGRRLWPSDLYTPAFFNGVMRSIASQWRHENARETFIEDDEEGATNGIEGGIAPDHDLNDLISRMRQALDGDPEARDILEHILVDSDREEAQVALGLDATAYDTARRRMSRHLFTAFGSGWTT